MLIHPIAAWWRCIYAFTIIGNVQCGISLSSSSSQLYWHITCLILTFTMSQPNGIVSTEYKKYMKHKTLLTAQNEIRIITFSSRLKHEESLTRDHQEVSCIHRWYGGMEALMTLSNLSIAASRFLFLLFALPTKPLPIWFNMFL